MTSTETSTVDSSFTAHLYRGLHTTLKTVVVLLLCATSFAGPLDTVPAGRWYQFQNSRLDTVAPSPAPAGDVRSVIYAWGGGIYDTDRDRLVVWGGGHRDYAGNEVYAFGPLTATTPKWERLTDPSTPPADNVPRGNDGRPVSRHTYSLLAYLPAPHNKMMSCAVGSQYSNGYGVAGVDFYDFTIDGRTGQPWSAGPSAPSNAYPYNSYCIYNPITQSVWYQDNGSSNSSLQEFNLTTQKWTVHLQYNPDSEPTPAMDTKRNLIVTTGRLHGVQVYDPANPKNRPVRVITAGPKAVEDGRFPGFVYDPVNDRFVGWNGGSALYILTPPADPMRGTWVWSQLPLDVANTVVPTDVTGTRQVGYVVGTYGRFRYVPSLHGVVLVNATDESVYFFKLPRGNVALPSVNLSANPTSVAAQGSSTLTWSSTNTTSCIASGAWSGAKTTSGFESRGPLTATSTFTLTCDNGAGVTASKSVTIGVTATPPVPTVDLIANPTTIPAGGSISLAWTTSNASSCTASGGWSGVKTISGSENIAVNQPTSYTLTCSGPSGQASDTVMVSTTSPTNPAPIVSLTSSAAKAAIGTNIRLSWSASNATTCIASGSWAGNKAVSGSLSVGPLNSNSTFVLTCTGTGGSGSASVAVAVVPKPTMQLAATPTTIAAGSNTRVTWSSTDTTSCTASGAWSGTKASSGTQDVRLYNSGTLYLTCKGFGAQVQKSVLITVETSTPPPTPDPSEVAKVNLISLTSVAQSSVPFTFGHVFKSGAVPRGASLTAKLADGSSIPLQVDAKATHPDGSLRHAVLSGKLGSLVANDSQALALSSGTPISGTAIPLSSVLSSTYNASVSLNVGGTVYTAAARDALAGTNIKNWLSGPIVSEWIAGTQLKTSAGAVHPHLMAYFHVRAYAGVNQAGIDQIRTDVVIENNWAFVPNPGNFNYTATVSVPGKTNYTTSITHYGRTRWHKRFWWGTEPRVYAKLDKNYLQDTKAIPKYENVQPSESYLSSVRRSTEPMSNGDQSANMDDSGYQPGIGPLPQWDAVYAVSTDVRAFDSMLANADGGSAYSVHIRDEKTGLPISIDNYPKTSLADPVGSVPALPSGGRSIYNEGQWSSHQPSIGYLPYVVTGDYFYLEEAQFWSAYNLLWPSKESRNGASGWWYTSSLRGQAWAYRSLAQAAYITPNNHALKSYFTSKLSSNLQHDIALYVSPGGPHKNNLGAMFMAEGNEQYRFFDYFMSWAVQYLVDLGFDEAVPLRNYKVKFPIGIMGISSTEYCFQAAAQYTWKVGPSGTSTFYPDFRTMFNNTVPGANAIACGTQAMTDFLKAQSRQQLSGPNGMLGDQTSTTYYFANLQPALAAAADSGVAGGQQAWIRSRASGVHPDYRDNPIWAVVPRSVP